MKVVILAGGFGTRISEESHLKPKPMIEIGGHPILWHIMKYYSHFGFNEFVICCGYKQQIIKEFFANYYLHMCDVTFDLTQKNNMVVHNDMSDPWKVTLVDTGLETMTGGRLKRVGKYLNGERFLFTYGDGVSNVDLNALIRHHDMAGKKATLTAIRPGGRYGKLDIGGNGLINDFSEKSPSDGGWVNGGFMVLENEVLNYIEGDDTSFEREPLETLAKSKELTAYKHEGFWQCMDTLRDKIQLEKLWNTKNAPWKVWNDDA